jgi:hypothetical protein
MANDRYRAYGRIVGSTGAHLSATFPGSQGFAPENHMTAIMSPIAAPELSASFPGLFGFVPENHMTATISAPASTLRLIDTGINHVGGADVTDLIQDELDACPNGTSASPITLRFFLNGLYRCDRSLYMANKKHIIIDLNGAEIYQSDPAPYGAETTIAAGSDGATVWASTINVASTAALDDSGVVLIVGTRGTGTVSQISYTGKTSTTLTGCKNYIKIVEEDTGLLATGQRVVQPVDGSLVRLISDTQTDAANTQFVLSQCSNIRFTSLSGNNGTLRGASRQGGRDDIAYIPHLEFQHNFRLFACASIEIDHIDHCDVFGDFIYLSWINALYCTNIWVHDCDFRRNGRVAITPSAVDGFEYGPNNTMTEVRRSFFDIEPPTNNARTTNMYVHDSHFGTKKLYWLAASGGIGKNIPVSNIVFENLTNESAMIIEFWAPDNTRRGPLKIINCDTIISTATYGTANGHLIRCKYTDGIEITNGTFPLQSRSLDPPLTDMRLLEATNCTNVVSTGNALTPETNDAAHQRRIRFEDFFGSDVANLANSTPPFYSGSTYTRVRGPIEGIIGGSLRTLDTTGVHSVYRSNAVLPSANMHAQVEISSINTNSVAADQISFGCCVRMSGSAETFYRAFAENVGAANNAANWDLVLQRVNAGVSTTLDRVSLGVIPGVIVFPSGAREGDRLFLRISGTTIKVSYQVITGGGVVEKISVSDSGLNGTSTGGMYCGIDHSRLQTTGTFINVNLMNFKYLTL